ncbi:ABC transporter permease [Spirosoma sp. BT702]|uniref:ABC transporter permease n=2 Tax=Spirosoma profusum TaxID=2771354 RepID=A0A927AQC6_9BACT|nr:ABC transporter permease [Spirosoma profusum]
MLRNYVKIALRNIVRQRGLTFINILGLSIGLFCFVFFLLYALSEFSFDRFHTNADRIYRVYQWDNWTNTGETAHPMPLGPAMKQDLPGVKQYVRIRDAWRESFTKAGDKVTQAKISFADPQFFSVFSFTFKKGSAASALNDLYNVVLTEETAVRLWGKTDVVGKIIEVKVQDKYEPFVVSAIIENIPSNSSITFQMLGNFNFLTTVTSDGKGQVNDWRYSSSQTYVQLDHTNSLNAVKKRLDNFYRKYNADTEAETRKKGWKGAGLSRAYGLQPLLAMHMDTQLKGAQVAATDPELVWILLSIATGILLISCINFTTLAIGRSVHRAKEVGVRKVMGGNKRSLVVQFIAEALLLTILSASLGLLLLQIFLPYFQQISERELRVSFVQFPELSWLLVGLILIVGLLAGSYPAWILSGFKAVDALKTKVKLSGSTIFTKSLVTVQFVLSAGFIIATLIILQQLNYIKSKNPGFKSENIIVVNADGTWPKEIYPFFKQQIAAHPGIIGVTGSDQNLGGLSHSNTEVEVNGQPKKINELFVERDYLQVMGMQLKAGRDFNPAITSDRENAVIINEAMMKEFGWTLNNVIGQQIKGYRKDFNPVVIGVVKDFNYQSFKMKIEPQLFHQLADYRPYKYFVRIAPGDPSQVLATLQASWKEVVPDFPFRYSFLNEDLNRTYKSEARWSNIVGWAGGISIFLACLGLLGLSALAVANRTKEIGIRKVLGASSTTIFGLLSKDFVKLVLVAVLIASPLAWWVMNKWLQDFAFRIDIEWWVFALAGLLTIGISIFTIATQAVKAALTNPVKSLRSE